MANRDEDWFRQAEADLKHARKVTDAKRQEFASLPERALAWHRTMLRGRAF